jgi:hypothetical protein
MRKARTGEFRQNILNIRSIRVIRVKSFTRFQKTVNNLEIPLDIPKLSQALLIESQYDEDITM